MTHCVALFGFASQVLSDSSLASQGMIVESVECFFRGR